MLTWPKVLTLWGPMGPHSNKAPKFYDTGVKTRPVQTLKVPVLHQSVVPSWCFYFCPFFLAVLVPDMS